MPDHDFDRRRLLAALGSAPLALGATRALGQTAQGQPLIGNPTLPEVPGKRTRWAVVGLGSFAVGQVIPGLLAANDCRITAFVSGTPSKLKDLGARYGVSKFYSYEDYDKIAQDREIDCVYIVLPVGLHAEYTIRALKAGKHVLCEKPMASTAAECEAMIAAARAAGKQLGVAYRVHFEPNNMLAKARIAAGDIGPLRTITCDHGFNANLAWAPHKWRLEKALAGGGSMFDIGVYGLNTSLMMTEATPTEVSAVYAYPRDDARFKEVEGGINWRLGLSDGASIQGTSSYCYGPYASRQRYFGANGSLWMEPATTYYDNHIVIDGGGGPKRELNGGTPGTQFAAQVDGFAKAARTGTPHRTPGEMGLRDIRIIEAMYRSADAGGAVIKL